MSTRAFRSAATDGRPAAPRITGYRGAVATHHHLSALAAADLLKAGGNAVDAAVGAVLVEGLVNPQMHTLGGECPMLIAMAGAPVVVVDGNTRAPAAATPEAFLSRGLSDVPDEGVLAAGVPAAPAALLAALARFGTMSFADVSTPARELARDGFALHAGILRQEKFGLTDLADKLRARWPGTAALYLPDGRLPDEGARQRNPALADILSGMAAAERAAGGDRARGIAAAHDTFYRGDASAAIDRFSRERDGLLRRADLETFAAGFEAPATLAFGGAEIHKCGAWNQGPALLQTLAILRRFDLAGMDPNGADYLHLLIEATKLAYADREQFYGDPDFADVPLAALLSADYAQARAGLIDPARADPDMRPGDPRRGGVLLPAAERLGGRAWGPGTVHVDVADAAGNMVAATPSGAWLKSCEVVPALGVPLGNRLMTFYLGPAHHPNVVAPRRRPRTTISPSLATRSGAGWLAFGSMGGDQQDQWQVQFLLNLMVFGMTIPEAMEAPKLSSEHFPGFFAPHDRFPNRVRIEPRVGAATLADLAARGHD
ncbi:MAG: gamma-glutamyltransferase family protein, partial [Alphaproteobacteria bacterium]